MCSLSPVAGPRVPPQTGLQSSGCPGQMKAAVALGRFLRTVHLHDGSSQQKLRSEWESGPQAVKTATVTQNSFRCALQNKARVTELTK